MGVDQFFNFFLLGGFNADANSAPLQLEVDKPPVSFPTSRRVLTGKMAKVLFSNLCLLLVSASTFCFYVL